VQLPIKFTAIAWMVFAAICLWFAIDGFSSLADNADPEQLSGGRSFAWFWAFLAGVGFVIAWLLWKLAGALIEDKDP